MRIERAGLALLRRVDPERAHALALAALRAGLAPTPGPYRSARLTSELAGLALPNPIGLAAGFDKNAEAIAPLARAGFGFLEVGAATPRPQPGNPKPRLFRLSEDQAAINRFGFNNEGAVAIAARLAAAQHPVPLGLNLGANKDSSDRIADFAEVFRICAPHIDFATINVSSPNTERLRDLQGTAALSEIIAQVDGARQSASPDRPVALFLKIAPDLTQTEIEDIAEVALSSGSLSGVIATNTTLARDGLQSPQAQEAGGLSGQPLFAPSTRVLARLFRATKGKLPLIGVGGVASADQAYAKIRAGASAVQLYTGLVYGGLSLVGEIARGLDALLERDGFAHVSEAVGSGVDDWI